MSALILSVLLTGTLASQARTPAGSAAPGDAPHAIDTLTPAWAAREDSLRLAADSAARGSGSGQAEAAPRSAAGDADGPALPDTSPGHGSLSGRVVSEMAGAVIAGARVILAGHEKSVETDADGGFGFPDLPPGSYSLLITHAGHAPLAAESLAVSAGRGTVRRLRLPDKALQGEKVSITGKAGKASDAGLLFARKNAPGVSDGISSEQVSKSADSDAAGAVKRVSGISIAGDGLVYVRGLGERYVNVQLNGMSLSSPDPAKRVIPLDLFPTRLIENLVVSKTFTADQPAEFAGGAIQIRTKGIPDRRIMEVSASAGYDPGSTFGRTLAYEGGEWDWAGFDDGTRALPEDLPAGRWDERSPVLGATPEERMARQREVIGSLPNVWTPHGARVPLGRSYGFTLGNRIPLGGDRAAGWLLGGSYSGKSEQDREFIGSVKKAPGNRGFVYANEFDRDVSSRKVGWGLLGTIGLVDGGDNLYQLTWLANRTFEDQVHRTLGKQESDYDSTLLYHLENTGQTLLNVQAGAEHRLGGMEDPVLRWTGSYSRAGREQPDWRDSKYIITRIGEGGVDSTLYNPEFPWRNAATSSFQDRYWYLSDESGYGGKVDLDLPLPADWLEEGSKGIVGASMSRKGRDYRVRRLSFVPGTRVLNSELGYGRPYEDVMALLDGSRDSGFVSTLAQRVKDDYDVEAVEWAVHGQADLAWTPAFRTITGLRLAAYDVAGLSRANQGDLSLSERTLADCARDGQCELDYGYDETRLLPAVSAVWSPGESRNLRASWTRTMAYPEYREMAPLRFYDYLENLEVDGNVNLKPTSILNYDLRWEMFPTAEEAIALSAFYKDFTDPVEARIRQGASNNTTDFGNAPSAFLYGFEAESRLSLERFAGFLSPFKALVNYTWITSEVEGERKRAMQGQSPYLINGILFFEPFRGAVQISLLYNRIGRRIARVGVGDFPDVYEESRETLEFAWSQRVRGGLKLKFAAKNLTDADIRKTQGGLVIGRTRPGRSFSLGAGYAF